MEIRTIIAGARQAVVEVAEGPKNTVVVTRRRDAGAAPKGRIWSELRWTLSRSGDFAKLTREQLEGRTVEGAR